MNSITEEMIVEIGVAMLKFYEDPRHWLRFYRSSASDHSAKTIRQCCYDSATKVGATYIETEATIRALEDQCHILGFGNNLGSFNFSNTTTIEMIRLVISAAVTQAERRLTLIGPRQPATVRTRPSSSVPLISSRAVKPPPPPPLVIEARYGDEQFSAVLQPPTPEITPPDTVGGDRSRRA